MRAFESIWAPNDTDALYARDFRTYLVCAEISRCQSISPEFNQLLMAWALERVPSLETKTAAFNTKMRKSAFLIPDS